MTEAASNSDNDGADRKILGSSVGLRQKGECCNIGCIQSGPLRCSDATFFGVRELDRGGDKMYLCNDPNP